jgi:hypothetical protein
VTRVVQLKKKYAKDDDNAYVKGIDGSHMSKYLTMSVKRSKYSLYRHLASKNK